jgi:hypothetical protein
MLYLLYLEYPRLLYPNALQIEYFHQAQIYHVLNYGTVTDPRYSFPRSDVAHAVYTASFIMVTGMHGDFVVSYVAPMLVKISLLTLACALSIEFSGIARWNFQRTLIMLLPLYILISDTEPLFINHYSYALPLYLLLLYTISKRDLNLELGSKHAQLLMTLLVASSLTITHIYFSTATALALFVALLPNALRRNKALTPQLYLLPVIVYIMWHAMASEWSIGAFIREFHVLSIALTRLLTFQLNPLKPVEHVKERFGAIPPKPDYQLYFILKWLDILVLQGLVVASIMASILLAGRKSIKLLLRKNCTYFMLVALASFLVFVGTFTAHPQRILEHLVLTLAVFTIVIIRLTDYSKKAGWIKTIVLLTVFAIMLSAPLKLIHYWGTSLTYIGFPEKSIYTLSYFAQHTGNPIDEPVHYIGPTPYWFLTEILARKQHFYPMSLNGPEGSEVFIKTLNKLKTSLSITDPHYIVIDLSPMLFMRSKYAIGHHVPVFIGDLMNLSSTANIVFTAGVTHMIWTNI